MKTLVSFEKLLQERTQAYLERQAKRQACKHEHLQEIKFPNLCRSVWECEDCGYSFNEDGLDRMVAERVQKQLNAIKPKIDLRKVVCTSCSAIIYYETIKTFGNQCPHCGAILPIYLERRVKELERATDDALDILRGVR